MQNRLPPLNTLRLFEAAARLVSFKNAAEELSITPSAVSHGIQTLEEWLGVPLFVRNRRGLALSSAGEAYYPTVQQALMLLSRGSEEVTARHGSQRLAISVAPTFATRWLIPRLPEFREKNPGIQVVIDTVQERVDLEMRSVDLAIRMGRGGWTNVFSEKIIREVLVPVCTPRLLDRVRRATGFDEVPLIYVASVSEEWTMWAKAAGLPPPDPNNGLWVDTLQLAFDAAAQGLGVAMGRRPLVDTELENGRLIVARGPEVPISTGYWLIGLESRADDPAIIAFRKWITAQIEEHIGDNN